MNTTDTMSSSYRLNTCVSNSIRIPLVLTFVCLTLLSGCGSQDTLRFTSLDSLTSLQRGLSLDQVQHRLHSHGYAEFLIESEAQAYRSVLFWYAKDQAGKEYRGIFRCLFCNGRLARVVGEIPENNWLPVAPAASDQNLVGPNAFARALKKLTVLDMSGSELKKCVVQWEAVPPARGCGDWGKLMFVLWPVIIPEEIEDSLRRDSLLSRFDPLKIDIGMTPEQVGRLFGKSAQKTLYAGNQWAELYGEGIDRSNKTLRYDSESWVAVVFRNNRVIGVFKDPFLDEFLPPHIGQ